MGEVEAGIADDGSAKPAEERIVHEDIDLVEGGGEGAVGRGGAERGGEATKSKGEWRDGTSTST